MASKEFDLQHPSGLRIHRGMSEAEVKKTPGVSRDDMQTGYVWYRFPENLMGGQGITMSLCFFHGQLTSINFGACGDQFGTSWDDWSEAKERDRAKATGLWLKMMGYPVGDYEWGSAWAEFDARSAAGRGGVHFKI